MAGSRREQATTPAHHADALEQHNAWRRPGFLLWHASLRWQRALTATLRPLGLTHTQFLFLGSTWYLERSGHPPSQRELADHTASDVMMTSQVIRALEALGLVTRFGDDHDRRVVRLRLTPAGRTLAERSVVAVDRAEEHYFGALLGSPEAMTVLGGLAGQVVDQPGDGR